MCHLFVGADPALWENETRSLRLSGMATSVRLERFFWTVLHDIAERDALTVSQLLQRLYAESLEEGHDLDNFASFLRVCCGRYLALQLDGEIPTDRNVAIRSLDAKGVLAREPGEIGQKKRQDDRFACSFEGVRLSFIERQPIFDEDKAKDRLLV